MSLPQRRMLQQLLEARAMATEAFLVASGGLHHNWQGEQAHEGRLVFFFNKRCLMVGIFFSLLAVVPH